jgi:hypothetical protein
MSFERYAPKLMMAGGAAMIVSGLLTAALERLSGFADLALFFRTIELFYGAVLVAVAGLWAITDLRRRSGTVTMIVALTGGAISGLMLIVNWYWRDFLTQPLSAGLVIGLGVAGAAAVGIAGILKLAAEQSAGAPSADQQPVTQPAIVRGLALLGGLGMVVGPLLRWRIRTEFMSGVELASERGITSHPLLSNWWPILGWIIVGAGGVTLLILLTSRSLSWLIATSVVGGIVSCFYLLEYGFLSAGAQHVTQPALGLIITIGGSALTGTAGVTAWANDSYSSSMSR